MFWLYFSGSVCHLETQNVDYKWSSWYLPVTTCFFDRPSCRSALLS